MPAGDLDIPTVLRCRGELCRRCHGRSTPQFVAPDQNAYNAAGLRSFLARRRDRENAMLRRTYYEELLTERKVA